MQNGVSDMIDLKNGDCLELMKLIPSESIDAIITDSPYGTTDCKWDSIIPFDLMWNELNRIIKTNGAIVLFGSEPFSSALRMSNIKMYKYDWIWKKNKSGNFQTVKYQPLKYIELISVFCSGSINYFPILRDASIETQNRRKYEYKSNKNKLGHMSSGKYIQKYKNGKNKINPTSIIEFNNDLKTQHPTQKPVALMEYLIKTYTNESETVLDFTMGSGTTGVACVNTKRNFIGIELDKAYFDIATKRINDAQNELKLF